MLRTRSSASRPWRSRKRGSRPTRNAEAPEDGSRVAGAGSRGAGACQRRSSRARCNLGAGLERLADGDLTFRLDRWLTAAYQGIKEDFNRAMGRLQDTVQAIAVSTGEVSNAAAEISTATTDLSQRTEEQAASLEQTLGLDGGDLRDGEEERRERAAGQLARRRAHARSRIAADEVVAEAGQGDVADRGIVAQDLRHHRR